MRCSKQSRNLSQWWSQKRRQEMRYHWDKHPTYKNNAKGRTPAGPPSTTTPTSGSPHRPREKKCRCGNTYFDCVEQANRGWNSRPYDCCLSKRRADKRTKKGGKKTNAAEHPFDYDSSSGLSPPARISSASLHTCRQHSMAGDHPLLNVTFTFPTASGYVEMKTEGAMADSGAHLCIFPISHLRATWSRPW